MSYRRLWPAASSPSQPEKGLLGPSDIRCCLTASGALRDTTDDFDTRCDAYWSQRTATAQTSGAVLFNEMKFRLAGFSAAGDDAGVPEGVPRARLELELGLTDYREHLVTNGSTSFVPRAGGVPSNGANALGVECVLLTSDRQAVLFRRSPRVSQYAGWFCCPGGHAEPRRLLSNTALLSIAPGRLIPPPPSLFPPPTSHDPSASSMQPTQTATLREWRNDLLAEALPMCDEQRLRDATVAELFHAAWDEIVEELGIDTSHGSEPASASPSCVRIRGLAALVVDDLGKPDAVFVAETSLSAAAVKKSFDARVGADAFESDVNSLLCIPCSVDRASRDPWRSMLPLGAQVTPPSAACLDAVWNMS